MTLDQAMKTECDACGKDAGHHRLTDTGNFYCLIPVNWRSGAISRNMEADEARLWMQNRARCSDLKKSPLSRMRDVVDTILFHVRGIGSDPEQLALDSQL